MPVVLEMFTRYDGGSTMKEIRDYLNDAGVTTVRGKAIDLNFMMPSGPSEIFSVAERTLTPYFLSWAL